MVKRPVTPQILDIFQRVKALLKSAMAAKLDRQRLREIWHLSSILENLLEIYDVSDADIEQ